MPRWPPYPASGQPSEARRQPGPGGAAADGRGDRHHHGGLPPKLERELVEAFDKNADGKLDAAEKQAAHEKARDMRQERRKKMRAKFDKNGDGQLDESERTEMRREWHDRLDGEKRDVLRKFDANGDGKLDEQEKTTAMRQTRERWEERRRQFIRRFDTDGDGKLSEQEKATAKAACEKEHAGRGKNTNPPATPPGHPGIIIMRVALARRGYSATGGAERYLLRFANGLATRGHQPVLLTGDAWPNDAWPHGAIRRFPGHSPRSFADAVHDSRSTIGCDTLFSLERLWACDTYRAGDGVHTAWLERRARLEPWWKSAFRRLQPKHRALQALESALFSGGAGRIVVNSKLVAREIQHHFQTPESKIHLVYNGYDLPAHESTEDPGHGRVRTRKLLGIPDHATLLLFTGSGWERKGLRFAIEALHALDDNHIHLLVAGSGKMHGHLRHPRAHYPGPVMDMAPLLAAADLFVLPTLYDPFSNACLEAARHGLPVITTTANGFSELIENDVHGTVIEAADATALADAIDHWSSDGRAARARNACAANAAPFTIDANVQATLDILCAI